MTSEEKKTTEAKYKVAENVYSMDKHGRIYLAKILKVFPPTNQYNEHSYLIHYHGWNSRHDEKVIESLLSPKNEDTDKIYGGGEKKPTKSTTARNAAGSSRSGTRTKKNSSSKSGGMANDMSPYTKAGEKSTHYSRATNKMKDRNSAESEVRYHKEIFIHIPIELKKILVDDGDRINRQQKLVNLPAGITVRQIVEDYRRAKDNDHSTEKLQRDAMGKSSLAILDYFNGSLGTQLLYKFERRQYDEYKKLAAPSDSEIEKKNSSDEETKGFEAVDHYGFEHLLRLFVLLGNMMAITPWNEYSLKIILGHVHDFIGFLNEKRVVYYKPDEDYRPASEEYMMIEVSK